MSKGYLQLAALLYFAVASSLTLRCRRSSTTALFARMVPRKGLHLGPGYQPQVRATHMIQNSVEAKPPYESWRWSPQ